MLCVLNHWQLAIRSGICHVELTVEHGTG